MDAWVIILIVLIFVIIYAMYMITKTASLIKSMSPLSNIYIITPTDSAGKIVIQSPISQNYYYEAWIYLSDAPVISSLSHDTIVPVPTSVPRILGRLDADKNDVSLNVFRKDATATSKYTLCVLAGKPGANEAKSYFVTEDFPTNKWVYLVMNVNGKLVEVYVNGKLLRTIYLDNIFIERSVTAPIKIGFSNLIGHITRVIRKPENIDPNKVWDQYLQGNGQYGGSLYGLLDYINSYVFKLDITKDGKIRREFTAQLGATETK